MSVQKLFLVYLFLHINAHAIFENNLFPVALHTTCGEDKEELVNEIGESWKS